jgi:triphosphatase
MEIELKLRIPASALDALRVDTLLLPPGNTRSARKQLDNIYFDTPERDLARARIALRLRKDGRRWLQTVKGGGTAQSGLHQREEVEFAVAGKALEWDALQGTRLGALIEPHRARLQPQFRTRFSREVRLLHGQSGAVIEMAIDQGEILAGKRHEDLCELELELKGGPVDDLFALALKLVARHPLILDNRSKAERGDALARHATLSPPVKAAEISLPADADAATVARLAIENCLAQWQDNETGFLNQPLGGGYDSEYLHQTRVAVRRLRVACGLLARLAGWHLDALNEIKRPLQQLGQQLGAARDWDVFHGESWPLLRPALDDAALQTLLQEKIDMERELAIRRARAALGGRGAQRVLLQLSRCLAQPAPDSAANPVANGALPGQLDALEHEMKQALPTLGKLKPEALHEVRIVAKKMRYLMEFVASGHETAVVEPWLKWLKKAQEVLGARNDRAVADAQLKALCQLLDSNRGEARRSLRAILKTQSLPDLKLPALPAPFWH